jgi:hypothetical protein
MSNPDGGRGFCWLAHRLAHETKNPCNSPYSKRSRKPLSVVRRIEGSNPSPSAQPGRFGSGGRLGARACGLSNRSAHSTEVRGRLQASTGFRHHWRTTGARRLLLCFLAGQPAKRDLSSSAVLAEAPCGPRSLQGVDLAAGAKVDSALWSQFAGDHMRGEPVLGRRERTYPSRVVRARWVVAKLKSD